MAQSWYNAIQAGAASLLPRVKEQMKSMQSGMEVKHLGWITEQVDVKSGVFLVFRSCPAMISSTCYTLLYEPYSVEDSFPSATYDYMYFYN